MRRWSAFLLVFSFLSLATVTAFCQPAMILEIYSFKKGTVIFSKDVRPGTEFCLKYTHSSDLTPIVDIFRVDDGGYLVLVEERYLWYGSGLEFFSHKRIKIVCDGRWTKVILNRRMKNLSLRVGRIAGHRIEIGGEQVRLKDIAGGGESVEIRVRLAR